MLLRRLEHSLRNLFDYLFSTLLDHVSLGTRHVYYPLHKRKPTRLGLATTAAVIALLSIRIQASASPDTASKVVTDGPPEWAYGTAFSAPQKSMQLDPNPQHVPLSTLAFTPSQIMN